MHDFSSAQNKNIEQPDSNYYPYFDDGTFYRANNALSVNTLALISGYINLNYQRKINKVWSVEVGGSKKFMKGFELLPDENFPDSKFVKGYGYNAMIKHNLGREAITNYFHIGFGYRYRNITFVEQRSKVQDYFMSFGYQQLYRGRFTTEFGASIGGSRENQEGGYQVSLNQWTSSGIHRNMYMALTVKVKAYFFTKI